MLTLIDRRVTVDGYHLAAKGMETLAHGTGPGAKIHRTDSRERMARNNILSHEFVQASSRSGSNH